MEMVSGMALVTVIRTPGQIGVLGGGITRSPVPTTICASPRTSCTVRLCEVNDWVRPSADTETAWPRCGIDMNGASRPVTRSPSVTYVGRIDPERRASLRTGTSLTEARKTDAMPLPPLCVHQRAILPAAGPSPGRQHGVMRNNEA